MAILGLLTITIVTVLLIKGLLLKNERTRSSLGTKYKIDKSGSPKEATNQSPQRRDSIVPFAPFHFGESAEHYEFSEQGKRATDIFTGAFISLNPKVSIPMAQNLLQLAKDHHLKAMVTASDSDPCAYWDGKQFDTAKLTHDVSRFLPSILKYEDVVIGILLLNEPFSPDSQECSAVPPIELYNAAKVLRVKLSENGLRSDFPLGFGAPPDYFKGVPNDDTINLSTAQYTSKESVSVANFVTEEEAVAASIGHFLYMTVNANTQGTQTDENLVEICESINPSITIMIGYWRWDRDGGNTLSDFEKVTQACNLR